MKKTTALRRPNKTRTAAIRAKRAGIGKAEYLQITRDAIDKIAAAQGWRPSEAAAAVADCAIIADEVWGKS